MPSSERSITPVIILVILHLPKLQSFTAKTSQTSLRIILLVQHTVHGEVVGPNNKLWFLHRLKKITLTDRDTPGQPQVTCFPTRLSEYSRSSSQFKRRGAGCCLGWANGPGGLFGNSSSKLGKAVIASTDSDFNVICTI